MKRCISNETAELYGCPHPPSAAPFTIQAHQPSAESDVEIREAVHGKRKKKHVRVETALLQEDHTHATVPEVGQPCTSAWRPSALRCAVGGASADQPLAIIFSDSPVGQPSRRTYLDAPGKHIDLPGTTAESFDQMKPENHDVNAYGETSFLSKTARKHRSKPCAQRHEDPGSYFLLCGWRVRWLAAVSLGIVTNLSCFCVGVLLLFSHQARVVTLSVLGVVLVAEFCAACVTVAQSVKRLREIRHCLESRAAHAGVLSYPFPLERASLPYKAQPVLGFKRDFPRKDIGNRLYCKRIPHGELLPCLNVFSPRHQTESRADAQAAGILKPLVVHLTLRLIRALFLFLCGTAVWMKRLFQPGLTTAVFSPARYPASSRAVIILSRCCLVATLSINVSLSLYLLHVLVENLAPRAVPRPTATSTAKVGTVGAAPYGKNTQWREVNLSSKNLSGNDTEYVGAFRTIHSWTETANHPPAACEDCAFFSRTAAAFSWPQVSSAARDSQHHFHTNLRVRSLSVPARNRIATVFLTHPTRRSTTSQA